MAFDTVSLTAVLVSLSFCSAFDNILVDKDVKQDEVVLKVSSIFGKNQRKSMAVFPDTIQLQITRNGQHTTLSLNRNTKLGINVPLSIERSGKIMRQNIRQKEITVFYQDETSVASFKVSTKAETITNVTASEFKYFGTFHDGDDAYLLQKTRGRYTVSKIKHAEFLDDSLKRLSGADYLNSSPTSSDQQRPRRSDNKQLNEVEILAVADYSVYKFWYKQSKASTFLERDNEAKQNIQQYYVFLMNAVDVRYQGIVDEDYEIRILLSGIHVADIPESSPWTENIEQLVGYDIKVDGIDLIKAFNKWCQEMENKLVAHDDALLFTNYDLTENNNGTITTTLVGRGYLGKVCTEYSQSVIEDDFSASVAGITAHELGHNLGAGHDDLDENDCHGYDHFIMAAVTTSLRLSEDIIRRGWKFSKCSEQYFGIYINKLNRQGTNCMTKRTANKNILEEFDDELPGQMYSPDMQCRNAHGEGSYLVKDLYYGNFTSICTKMYCQDPDNKNLAFYTTLPWDGTSCGVGKICRSGRCTKYVPNPNTCIDSSPFCGEIKAPMCEIDCLAKTCCKKCQTYKNNKTTVCVTSCDGLPNGDYQSCEGCNVYATCSNKILYDNRPCPPGLVWTDDKKWCDFSSATCF